MPNGDYNVSISADVFNQVFEFQSDNNNFEGTVFGIVQQLPDLTVRRSSITLITNSTGNYIACNFSVANIGVGQVQVSLWENRIYISSRYATNVLSTFSLETAAFNNKTLDLFNLIVYIPTAYYGAYDLYLSVDARGEVLESNEINNYIKIGSISLIKRQTDLIVISLLAPETAIAGSTVVVQWEVENNGNLASGNWLSWYEEIVLSFSGATVAVIGQELVTFTYFFQPGQRYLRRVNATIPAGLAGVHQLVVTTGYYIGLGGEGRESNISNNRIEVNITLRTPPLPEFKLLSCSIRVITISSNVRLLVITCIILLETLETVWIRHFSGRIKLL